MIYVTNYDPEQRYLAEAINELVDEFQRLDQWQAISPIIIDRDSQGQVLSVDYEAISQNLAIPSPTPDQLEPVGVSTDPDPDNTTVINIIPGGNSSVIKYNKTDNTLWIWNADEQTWYIFCPCAYFTPEPDGTDVDITGFDGGTGGGTDIGGGTEDPGLFYCAGCPDRLIPETLRVTIRNISGANSFNGFGWNLHHGGPVGSGDNCWTGCTMIPGRGVGCGQLQLQIQCVDQWYFVWMQENTPTPDCDPLTQFDQDARALGATLISFECCPFKLVYRIDNWALGNPGRTPCLEVGSVFDLEITIPHDHCTTTTSTSTSTTAAPGCGIAVEEILADQYNDQSDHTFTMPGVDVGDLLVAIVFTTNDGGDHNVTSPDLELNFTVAANGVTAATEGPGRMSMWYLNMADSHSSGWHLGVATGFVSGCLVSVLRITGLSSNTFTLHDYNHFIGATPHLSPLITECECELMVMALGVMDADSTGGDWDGDTNRVSFDRNTGGSPTIGLDIAIQAAASSAVSLPFDQDLPGSAKDWVGLWGAFGCVEGILPPKPRPPGQRLRQRTQDGSGLTTPPPA